MHGGEKGKFRCSTIVTNPKISQRLLSSAAFKFLHCSRLANMSCNNFARDKAFISLRCSHCWLCSRRAQLSLFAECTWTERESLCGVFGEFSLVSGHRASRARNWVTKLSMISSERFFVNFPPQAGRKSKRFFCECLALHNQQEELIAAFLLLIGFSSTGLILGAWKFFGSARATGKLDSPPSMRLVLISRRWNSLLRPHRDNLFSLHRWNQLTDS